MNLDEFVYFDQSDRQQIQINNNLLATKLGIPARFYLDFSSLHEA